jgi:hypothetical protein
MQQYVTIKIRWDDFTIEKQHKIEQSFIEQGIPLDEIDYYGEDDGVDFNVIGQIEMNTI